MRDNGGLCGATDELLKRSKGEKKNLSWNEFFHTVGSQNRRDEGVCLDNYKSEEAESFLLYPLASFCQTKKRQRIKNGDKSWIFCLKMELSQSKFQVLTRRAVRTR